MAIKQGPPTIYDLSEGNIEYRYVRGRGVVLFANHGGELYSLRLQKSALPKAIDKISSRTLAQGETTLVSSTVTSTTNITGNYVATVTGGAGIASTGATTGEDIDHSLSLDASDSSLTTVTAIGTGDLMLISDESTANDPTRNITIDNLFIKSPALLAGAVMDSSDYVLFLDGGGTGDAKKEAFTDLLDTIAGTVGTTGLDRSGATLVVTDLHPVGVSGADNQLLTDDGDGTVTSESNLTFSGSTLTVTGNITVPNDGDIGSVGATDAIQISSAGIVTLKDDLLIKDGGTIGTATDVDAITIAAAGAVTFSQRDVHSLGITIADAGNIGSASDLDAISIAAGGDVTFSQDIKLGTYSDPNFSNGMIGSASFTSGFTGGGWKLEKDTTATNEFDMTLDNLVVRGTMSVYELVIQQIKCSNGSIVVSSSGKVEAVAEYANGADNVGKITFESTVSGTKVCPFIVNDIIMMQRVNIDSFVGADSAAGGTDIVSKKVYVVTHVTQNVVTTGDASFTNDTAPVKGDEFVRIGSTSDANRRGILYLTSDDTNAPFMDVKDGVDSYANWHSTSTTKVRVGKLSGITDSGLNGGSALSGYGLYGGNVFLKGAINATSGHIGADAAGDNGWLIAESKLSNTPVSSAYLQLDGVDANTPYLSLGRTTDDSPMTIKTDDNITICGWIRFGVLGTAEPIWANNTLDTAWSGLYLYKRSSNKLSLLWGDTTGLATGDYERVEGASTFSVDTWTFFVVRSDFTHDGDNSTNHKIQFGTGSTLAGIQSVASAGASDADDVAYTTGEACIGKRLPGTDEYARLDMKNFAVWNETLSDAEITALFNGGDYLSFGTNSGGYASAANLQLHLDFTTGSIADLTGNTSSSLIGDATVVGDGKFIGLVQSSASSLTNSMSGFYAGADASTGANAAISFGTDGKLRGNGIYVKDNIEYLITASRIFGNGSDGPLTIFTDGSSMDSVVNDLGEDIGAWITNGILVRDIYCTNLTMLAGVNIKTGGYRIFVRDTLLLMGTGISLFNTGSDGNDGSTGATDSGGGAGGTGGGAGALSGSLLGGITGGVGGAGGNGDTGSGSTDGAGGVNVSSQSNCIRIYSTNNGVEGASGAVGSGSGTSGSDGDTRSANASSDGNISITNADLTYIIAMRDFFTIDGSSASLHPAAGAIGGGGGGGGGRTGSGTNGNGGGGGGQSGGSGGHLMLVAREILPIPGRTLADLSLESKGGVGGDGGNGATNLGGGDGGAGAGGNGGDGGCIVLITGTDPGVSGSGGLTRSVAGGAAGANSTTGATANIGTPIIGITGTVITCHV